MNVYYLCPRDTQIVHKLDNPYGTSHRVVVKGGADWYAARLRAIQHAAQAGARHALIVAGHAEPVLLQRPDGRRDNPAVATRLGPEGDHGLLLYLSRLLACHAGAVLLAPLGARLPAMADFYPVIPMVSAYSVSAVMANPKAGEMGLEYQLCRDGYRVITLGDYEFQLYGEATLDTFGTATSWQKANDNALKEFLA